MKIRNLCVDNIQKGLITDNLNPTVTFYIESDKQETVLKSATISINGFEKKIEKIEPVKYEGEALKPYTRYEVKVVAVDSNDETDEAITYFETGKLSDPWVGKWISDKEYHFKEKSISPTPMLFRKKLSFDKKIESAKVYVSAIGIYNLYLNDKKVGN